MQRLSMDSSASKLYSYGGRKDDTYYIDDLNRKESASSSPPPSSSSVVDYEDHELKDAKPRRLSLQSTFAATNQKQEKLVHLIPVFTLICFFILYLSSHNPSPSDLSQFNGFTRPSKHLESNENDDISGYALAIRTSTRNLQETESLAAKSLPRRRTSHRKIAVF